MLKAARKIPGKAIASVMTADTFMKPLNFDSAATLLSLPLVNAAISLMLLPPLLVSALPPR